MAKGARLVKMLAEAKGADSISALSFFFAPNTHKLLLQPESGLQLMGDGYILEDLLNEIKRITSHAPEAPAKGTPG